MSQQTFQVIKHILSDDYMSYSQFGSLTSKLNTLDAVAVVPNQPMEFLIYNGKGSTGFSFEVGAYSRMYLDSDPSIAERIVPIGADLPSENELNFFDSIFDNLDPLVLDDSIPGNIGDGVGGGGGVGTEYHHAAILVELFKPKSKTPSKSWSLSAESNGDRFHKFKITSESDPQLVKKDGWWRCQITIRDAPADMNFRSTSYIRKAEYQETLLTKRWLKHAFWNVMSLLAPKVSLNGHLVNLELAEELSGIMKTPALKESIVLPNSDLISVSGQSYLSVVDFEIRKGAYMLEHFKNRRDRAYEAKTSYLNLHLDIDSDRNYIALLNNYDRWEEKYKQVQLHINANDPVLVILPIFTRSELVIDIPAYEIGIEFEENPYIFIKIKEQKGAKCLCVADISYRIRQDIIPGIILSAVEAIGDFDLQDYANDKIEEFINKYEVLIGNYMYLALEKACGYDLKLEKLTATNKGWKCNSYRLITHPDPTKFYKSTNELFQTHPADLNGNNAAISSGAQIRGARKTSKRKASARRASGNQTIDTKDLRKLDNVDTIVIIMMENRSFDHLLGNLHTSFPDVGYTCFNSGHSNPPSGNFIGPIYAEKVADLFYPNPSITPISPEHAYKHVMRQISDGNYDVTKPFAERDVTTLGLMQGFTADIQYRFMEVGGNKLFPNAIPTYESPQLVMSYNTDQEVPFYYTLAQEFKVLDHWFAAHPGATWPNRIATVTGKLIELDNFNIKDTRLGYFKERTIFDTLNQYEVDWRYLESNVSIARIFDNFRTDDKNVIPLHKSGVSTGDQFTLSVDDFKELDDLLEKDKLPRVIFIDPRFSDAPPLKLACDDIPPVSLANGQEFIETVYSKFRNSQHWNKIMMLITYDEHGGFFDHVAPPGTPHSLYPEPVPAIYVDGEEPENPDKGGPTNMGVRVPTFLISPYVKPKSVSHIIFDHTSIIKTILLHNRNKVPSSVIPTFGDRVAKANHLGMALDDSLRTDVLQVRTETERRQSRKEKRLHVPISDSKAPKKGTSDQDFHQSLNGLFFPKT